MITSVINLISNSLKIEQVGGVYILEEKSLPKFPKTKIKCSGQIAVYKFDDHKKLFPFYNDVQGAKAISDFVIFIAAKENIFVFITEVSTARRKTRQFEPTKCFVEFIEKTLTRLGTKPNFVYRYIILVEKNPPKLVTRPGKAFTNGQACFKAGTELTLSSYCIS